MNISFRQFFRLIFVVFSLYLLGDALSRWDGFSYYAPFSEFLPSIALASILWSIVSVCAAVLLWTLLILFLRLCSVIRIKAGMEHFLLWACFFVLTGVVVWKGKTLLWPLIHTTLPVKLAVLLGTSTFAAGMTWLFRDRADLWVRTLLDRITPLVWVFGLCVILSVPVVVYSAWHVGEDNKGLPETVQGIGGDKSQPNIVLVTFDALAARHMSVYGYSRETTPFIKRWSRNASVFTMAEASSNFTTPSVASLMTGKRVWTHQTYQIEGSPPVRVETESLPALLKEHGYYNIALVVNPFASVEILGMSGSFDIAPLPIEFGESSSLFGWKFGIIDKLLYRGFGGKIRLHNWILKNEFIFSKVINLFSRNISQTTVPPAKVFNRFLDIIQGGHPGPLFAWIHVFPPHDPYLPPPPFRGRFSASPELRTYKSQEQLVEESYKYLFQYRPFPAEMQPAVDLMRDHYDEYIAYMDKTFEDFIEGLNRTETANTVIILSADHGESFEHGYFTHGGPFLYEEVTHIPLVINVPGQDRGKAVNTLVEQVDITATILDLAGIAVPRWMEGRSLLPLMQGAELDPRPAFSMNFQGNRSLGHPIENGSIAVWEGDYKMIHYLERKETLLFNLIRDPGERQNIADSETALAGRLLEKVKERLETINKNRQ